MRRVSTVFPRLRNHQATSPSLIGPFRTNTREHQPPLIPSHLHQQTRQMTTERQIRRSPLECRTTHAPMSRGFSCDWDNWDCGSFIRTMPRFNKITRVEFLFHRIYEQTGAIKPLACNMEGHDPRLVFETEPGEYYYFWDGTWGHLYRYPKEDFKSRDEFLLRFNDADVREGKIMPPPSEERYSEIADATSLENPRP
ncbi:hypothetical protein C8R46DRAFT_1192896 [Mycena filopes]|nr:hypothetical protein C8R46DRAFT_1192896 [Mycena filopes]